MKKISIEFHINDDAAKKVVKTAKIFANAIVGLVKGHGVKVDMKDSEEKPSKK